MSDVGDLQETWLGESRPLRREVTHHDKHMTVRNASTDSERTDIDAYPDRADEKMPNEDVTDNKSNDEEIFKDASTSMIDAHSDDGDETTRKADSLGDPKFKIVHMPVTYTFKDLKQMPRGTIMYFDDNDPFPPPYLGDNDIVYVQSMEAKAEMERERFRASMMTTAFCMLFMAYVVTLIGGRW